MVEITVRYLTELDQFAKPKAPQEDDGWWATSGTDIATIAVMAFAGITSSQFAAAQNITRTIDDPLVAPQVNIDEMYGNIELMWTISNRVFILNTADETSPPPGAPAIKATESEVIPELTLEPSVYIIHPGNWQAGTDEIPKPAVVEEYWENGVAPEPWSMLRFAPHPFNDDPSTPKVPSGDSEFWLEPGPHYAPWLAVVLGEKEWYFSPPLARIDQEYWFEPNSSQDPFPANFPLRQFTMLPDDSLRGVASVNIVEEELWKNPFAPFPYWNKWPSPAWQQIDPGGLLGPPEAFCVVTPPVSSSAIQTVTFTPTAFAQVVFTDVCGTPLS